VRQGGGLTPADIAASCEGSLRRLQTDVIDLYQIHWPERHVPTFGEIYYQPSRESSTTSILEQLQALDKLVRQGKVRAIGLSNETPYGVHEFVRLAEQSGLARVATVQNPYSPLAFGALTGKYDAEGLDGPSVREGRLSKFERMRNQRWARPEALAAAKRYNALAREHGLTPTRMALAWCYTNWRVASTIIGVTSLAQLDEDIDAFGTMLSPELLAAIDRIRWEIRDPAA